MADHPKTWSLAFEMTTEAAAEVFSRLPAGTPFSIKVDGDVVARGELDGRRVSLRTVDDMATIEFTGRASKTG